jgi:hypothetical protein
MITAYTANCLAKLSDTLNTETAAHEYNLQYVLALIRIDAVKGKTESINYYDEKLIPILTGLGFKVEIYSKLNDRMLIKW